MRNSKRIRNSKRMRRKSRKLLKGGSNLERNLNVVREKNPRETREDLVKELQRKQRSLRLPSPDTVRYGMTGKKHPNTIRLGKIVKAAIQKQKDLKAGRPIARTLKKKPNSAYNNAIREMQSVSRAVFNGPIRSTITSTSKAKAKSQPNNNNGITKFKAKIQGPSVAKNSDFILAYKELPNKYKPKSFGGMSAKDKKQIGDLRRFFSSVYEKKMKKKIGTNIVPWAG